MVNSSYKKISKQCYHRVTSWGSRMDFVQTRVLPQWAVAAGPFLNLCNNVSAYWNVNDIYKQSRHLCRNQYIILLPIVGWDTGKRKKKKWKTASLPSKPFFFPRRLDFIYAEKNKRIAPSSHCVPSPSKDFSRDSLPHRCLTWFLHSSYSGSALDLESVPNTWNVTSGSGLSIVVLAAQTLVC